MKRILLLILIISFTLIALFAEETIMTSSTTNVFFSYKTNGYVGFSSYPITDTKKPQNDISALDFKMSSNKVSMETDTIYLYYQIFTPTPVTISLSNIGPLIVKESDTSSTATQSIPWKNNSKDFPFDSTKQSLEIYKDTEDTNTLYPRIGYKTIQFIITESTMNSIKGEEGYTCTMTLSMEVQ